MPHLTPLTTSLTRLGALAFAVACLATACSDPDDDTPAPDPGSDADVRDMDGGEDLGDANTGEADTGDTGDTGDTSDMGAPDVPDAEDASPDIDPVPLGAWTEWSVQGDGPFATGLQVHEHTYSLPTGVDRTINVYVWYPTRSTSGEPGGYLGGTFPDAAVFLNAAPADPVHEGGFPVTIHSHGHRAYGGEITDRAQHAASHGWVVIALDHTGNTITEPDNTPFEHWYHRPLDVSAALDLVESFGADNPLSGKMVTDRAVLTGHSRGAFTVWALAGAAFDAADVQARCGGECSDEVVSIFTDGFRDERLVGVVPQAGTIRDGWYGESGHAEVSVPMFFMSGSEDDVGGQDQFDNYVDGLDFTWVEFEGGCHLTFTLGILCNTLGTEDGWFLNNTYTLAFARRIALEDDDPEVVGLLDGSVAIEGATVRVKE